MNSQQRFRVTMIEPNWGQVLKLVDGDGLKNMIDNCECIIKVEPVSVPSQNIIRAMCLQLRRETALGMLEVYKCLEYCEFNYEQALEYAKMAARQKPNAMDMRWEIVPPKK